MKIKGKQKIEIAKEISAHRSKKHPLSVNEIMKMNKSEFLALWQEYEAFYEADDMLGDAEA